MFFMFIKVMSSERNIILKNWSALTDDSIIKEAATKGKYINLCISFLAKRRKTGIGETRIYFYEKVRNMCNNYFKITIFS